MIHNSKFVFFGSSEFSIYVLEELKLHSIVPSLIVTTPDKPKGRKLVLTPNVVKIWAQNHGIEILDPKSLKNNPDLVSYLVTRNSDIFLVASYGKIIPKEIFEIPSHKTLNIHPSLLPKYRGASPIQSQILNDEKDIGVTIMQIDEGMDTGPIISQKITPPLQSSKNSLLTSLQQEGEPEGRKALEKRLAIEGTRLFAHILPEWLMGVIDPIIQNEYEATYCQKIEKSDGELKIDLNDLSKNSKENLLKINAYEEWPGAYFFYNGKRFIIKKASIEDSKLKIERLVPEGKSEMSFEDFLRGNK